MLEKVIATFSCVAEKNILITTPVLFLWVQKELTKLRTTVAITIRTRQQHSLIGLIGCGLVTSILFLKVENHPMTFPAWVKRQCQIFPELQPSRSYSCFELESQSPLRDFHPPGKRRGFDKQSNVEDSHLVQQQFVAPKILLFQ